MLRGRGRATTVPTYPLITTLPAGALGLLCLLPYACGSLAVHLGGMFIAVLLGSVFILLGMALPGMFGVVARTFDLQRHCPAGRQCHCSFLGCAAFSLSTRLARWQTVSVGCMWPLLRGASCCGRDLPVGRLCPLVARACFAVV